MIWIILTMLSLNVNAEGPRSRFSADKYVRKAQDNKVILEGNVTVVKESTVLKADSVDFNTKTEQFSAIGDVSFIGDNLNIRSSELQGDFNSPKGIIKDGKIVSGSDIFEGREIKRITKKHFLIKEGMYTSCQNDPPDWRLYGNDIDMTTGQYAHLKDVVIESFGLPVTYLPYLVMPLKNERQSGFLPPSFGFGTDGFNINEPYFWAISRSQDATFTLGHYGNRGLKEAIEFRSVYAEESNTNMYYFHIDDTMFASTIYNNAPLGQKSRNAFKMDQTFKFLDATYARTKLLYASDSNIPRDFSDEMEGRADPALESKFVFTTHTQNVAYTLDAAYYQDLLGKNPLDSNKMQIQRLPEFRVNVAKTKYSIFMFETDASYLNVYRSAPYFDDSNKNGFYDNNEFIRTGQRFDLYPRVSIPITTQLAKITPQAGIRYDFYKLPTGGNASRTYVDFRTNLLSEISRIYQRDKNTQFRAIKHSIEPFAEYHVIPMVKQSNHPFFNATQNNINSPMFDSIDQIGKTNLITYGITNRMLAKYIKNFVPMKTKEQIKEEVEEKKIEEEENDKKTNCKECESKKIKESSIVKESTDKFLELREPIAKNMKKRKKKKRDDDDFTVYQPVQWKLYQSYNFLDTTGKPFGYVYSDILGYYEWVSLLLSNFYNVYTKKMGVSSQLGLTGRSKYIQLSYYYDKTDVNINNDQLQMQFGFSLWRFATNVRFILNNTLPGTFSQKIQDKYFDLRYTPSSACWFLKFAVSAPYDKPGLNTAITFNLLISGQAIGFGSEGNFMNAMNFGSR